MILSILIVILLIFGVVKYKLYKYRMTKYFENNVTIPKDQIPLFGYAHKFFGQNTEQIMDTLVNICDQNGCPQQFWFGPISVLFVGTAEDMQAVLTSPNCLQKSYVYNFFINKNGLFTAPAQLWKGHRKLLNPTFNQKILQSFIPVFNDKTKILVNRLETMLDKGTFDVGRFIFPCTLDMVCATTLGYDTEVQLEKNHDFLEGLEALSAKVAERMFTVFYHLDFIYKRTNHHKEFMKAYHKAFSLPGIIKNIKQKEYLNEKTHLTNTNQDEETFYKTPQIFIHEVFKFNEKGLINDADLLEQIETIIVGGNETSALTTSHVILMLAIHQDIQEKVFEEVKSIYEFQDSYSDNDSIGKLNYMEMVIKETMRLFPVGPFLGRTCTADTKTPGYTIPAGTLIMLAFHHLHRDPKVWGNDSHIFNPNNFLPEKVKDRHPYSFLPFSGGPRNCIGMKYGWISMKIMLAALIRKYKFTTDLKFDELKTKWDITLKIVNKHMVKIEKRNY